MLRTLLLVLAMAGPAAAEAASPVADARDVARNAIQGYIAPGYERLHGEAELLEGALDALCTDPGDAGLAFARDGFGRVVDAFSRVENFRFGPIMRDNRLDKLLFWPDRRGIGLRQVQAAIAEEDETAADPATLAGKSVALQGLGALEFVLFGTGAEDLATAPPESFRCRFGRAIAVRVAMNAREVSEGWEDPGGIAGWLTAPGPKNPLYRNGNEVLAEIIGVIVHGIDAIRDIKLIPLIGRDGTDPDPRAALFRRSGKTLGALKSDFAGLAQLFEVSGLGLLLPEDQRMLAGSALFEFRNAGQTFEKMNLDAPIEATLADPEELVRLKYLLLLTRSLQRLVGTYMAPALGLTVGFSALDGD